MHRTSTIIECATMLLPDMPVSEGPLPTVKQNLGEVDVNTALVTNLTRDSLHRGDKLILYTLTQDIRWKPTVYFKQREVMPDEMTETADGLALVSDEFPDDMKGWALVHVRGESCSTQTAATSYGGLTAD